ncbi:MAG TPA: Dabb family protein [Burkholderiales bacterium]|nr:Dabb family protein [Burkholderiales bacterium]
MFYHIVMMRFQDPDRAFHDRVHAYVKRVRRELTYVRAYDYCRNEASRAKGFDWAIIAAFDSSADHDRYQGSTVHQEMKAFMMPRIADLVVCDSDSAGARP